MSDFSLTDSRIDPATLLTKLQDPAAGAVITFDGRVRDHNDGHRVQHLEYQAYAALASKVGNQILESEVSQHGILQAVAIHRTGPIAIGESAVWVGVSSEHRAAGFAAAQSIMERLKYELPIWKKETYADGSVEWVGPDNNSAATGEADDQIPEWKAELREIWISTGHDFLGQQMHSPGDHGIQSLDEVECVAGMGLKGDRYFGHKADFKGQATFFDADVVEQVRVQSGKEELSSGEFRRNFIVRGVRLSDWIGKRFRFQGIEFEGSEECSPCQWMDRAVATGTKEFLKPSCRGGLRARILTDGVLRTQ